eukprot:254918-Pleurochrysis_carterae.AAC.1
MRASVSSAAGVEDSGEGCAVSPCQATSKSCSREQRGLAKQWSSCSEARTLLMNLMRRTVRQHASCKKAESVRLGTEAKATTSAIYA